MVEEERIRRRIEELTEQREQFRRQVFTLDGAIAALRELLEENAKMPDKAEAEG